MKIIESSQLHKSLAERIYRKIFKKTGHNGGHVHFHVRGHEDQIILLCHHPDLGKVVAKSPHCKKGECVRWEDSSFAPFNREDVLEKLVEKIFLIQIDIEGCEMSWPILEDFLSWLEPKIFPKEKF